MSLYYALPVFFYLLGKCFRSGDIFLLFKLGITVIACFTVILGPFYYYGGINGLQQVLHRLFPFQRGLFEDKVGNFWCALNVLVKLKNMFDIPQLVRLSAVATLVTSVPSCLKVFFYPSRKAFLNALSCTSLAFFLFSFQVHEKSILIPLLPVLLLSNTDYCNALIVEWFINISMFSMFPLILKDKLVLAFVGLLLVWNSLSLFTLNGPFSGKSQPFATFLKNVVRISYFLAASILIAQAFVEPPAKYPDLFAVLNSVLSATCFGIIYLYFLFQRTY
jgi:alpha-1,3-glucosyltransferase